MKRYEAEINGGEPWHEPADDGMWVLYDDALAAIDSAVAAERERCASKVRAEADRRTGAARAALLNMADVLRKA